MTNAQLQLRIKELEASANSTAPQGVWENIKVCFQSTTDVLTGTARTTSKLVRLVENEADNLHELQAERLDETSQRRLANKPS